MTVYVDDMQAHFRTMKMCHMIADTEAELHAMADKIGVARKWHQGNHYDICLSKRALAIDHGAVQITMRQAGCMTALARHGLPMAPPETAIERFRVMRGLSETPAMTALRKAVKEAESQK
jgi:hypothetical protein